MSNELLLDSLTGTVSILRHSGSFKDYLKGLDLIRQQITDQEQELKRALLEFYKVTEIDEALYNQYLKSINNYLNSIIDSDQMPKIVLNSEKKLIELINGFAKSNQQTDKSKCLLIIESLTDFHENLKYTQEILQIILDNFEKEILTRLKKLSINDLYNLDISNQSIDYNLKIKNYYEEIDKIIGQFRLLIVSCKNRMNMDLLTKSALVDRLTVDCETNKIPLLLVIPDLNTKLENVFLLGKMWLDREEIFLYQVCEEIRELKVLTKEKCLKMAYEKENHLRLIKEMKSSNLMVQNNKQKMTDIKIQLKELNEQVLLSQSEYEKKINQKKHWKSMMEFLEISISQTKKNYSLQFKRQKLQKEIKELETSLLKIQENISEISSKIDMISNTVEFVESKSKNDEKDFYKIKTDLEKYSQNVLLLKKDLKSLKKLLNTYQSIELLRTSPEYVENIFDLKCTEYVKLAPSLLKKISLKKQLLS